MQLKIYTSELLNLSVETMNSIVKDIIDSLQDKLHMILFERFPLTFNNSVGSDWMFLWWILNDISLLSKSSKELMFSLQTTDNDRLCKRLILLMTPLIWNIRIKEQWSNYDSMNTFLFVHMKFLYLSCTIYYSRNYGEL